ncbi:MAG: tetratricopeptide repeat protein [Gemmatimonadaceae bacterium]
MIEALRLRDTGDFAGSARVLRAYLALNPLDPEAARLLAETLYWLNDVEGAGEVYAAALVKHPDDSSLRLRYGRMLMETGHRARARELLMPLREVADARAEADALLGTIAYWDGDLTAAQRLFRAALRDNPDQAEARRQLQEIRVLSAPWVRAGSALRHDDQPLDRVALGLEAGWFATPLLPVTVRVEPMTFRRADSATRRLLTAELSVAHFAPALRLETEVAGGVVQRAGVIDAHDWQGRAVVGVRLSPHVTLRGRAERAPYLFTTSSLDTPIMTHTAAAQVHWSDPRGWLGEARYQRQRYPDANTVRTAYAWVLGPLIHQGRRQLQAGYAFADADAAASRFVLADASQRVPPDDPRFNTAGRYVPYYTPSQVVSHSAIAALTLRPSSASTFRAGGSFGVRATDQAPTLVVSAGQVQRVLVARTFTPWDARSSLDIALRSGLTLTATGETGRTVFYSWATAGLQITYRFAHATRPDPR